MSRPAPVPFDPDQLGQVTDRAAPAPSSGGAVMLSDLLASLPATAEPATASGPGTARPLSRDEKWQLTALARRTYQQLQQAGQIPAGQTEDAFRQTEAVKACQRRISEATAGDRMLIQAHFLRLKGSVREAQRATAKAASTATDIALHHLRQALAEGDKTEAYAAGIARRIFKRELNELSHKEVWNVIYTVRNANNAAARKGSPNNRYKSLKAKRATNKETKSL